ncbi:MAG: HNH endonuclease [Propionibacteriaceae bacterium]|nr:HNH endonuclease [Propionibacteriaceae bacterium]
MTSCSYRVGIDVGLNSVGLAAIKVDDEGFPTEILNLETIIHDGGVEEAKTAKTRKAISGVARRMRRLVRRRRQRLAKLDDVIRGYGWPIVCLETVADPYYPWRVRKELVTHPINRPDELYEKLSVALRHIARHRGWRNPYTSVSSLMQVTEPSKEFEALFTELLKKPQAGVGIDDSMTVAQIVCEALRTDLTQRIRGNRKNMIPLLESKIHQSDHVREIRRIWDMQGLPEEQFREVVQAVFHQRSPRGAQAHRVGKDPLPGMGKQPRAEKASLAFQRFRIVQVVANLRVKDGSGQDRPLSPDERRSVVDLLWNAEEPLTWADVTEHLGIDRRDLTGTAKETELGERAAGKPPVNITQQRVLESGLRSLIERWESEDDEGREALIEAMSNGSGSGLDEKSSAVARANEFLGEMPEEDLAKVDDKLKLPEGRAAYSAKSMRLMTERMESSTDDLHAARKHCFPTVDDLWKPPADPIGLPVGNPAVDRVLKIVARYLSAAESMWGDPISVNIEHTRDGLMSEKMAREQARERNRNAASNDESREELIEYLAGSDEAGADDAEEASGPSRFGPRQSDVYRWRAMQRQNCQCLYCGTTLMWGTFEMDHIVPRAGQGATNTQTNLAAVCKPCNHLKGKIPFAVWAKTESAKTRGVTLKDALRRADDLFPGLRKTPRDRAFIRAVQERLRRTDEDEAIDNRSMESVGWMANELHHRIEAHYRDERGAETKVGVFRGWITSEARKAAGIQDRFLLIGGGMGKNRLDRRHHAVDAATIAMLRPGIGQALVVRDNLRRSHQIDMADSEFDGWREFKGANPELFDRWTGQMENLADLVQDALEADRVPVFEFLRLRLGNSAGHEDTIRPLDKYRVGDEMPMELIDRSAYPQQWVALTRAEGFDPQKGLPADPNRRIRIGNDHYGPDDEIGFFPTGAGCIAVRGGYAELGASFHHARIYRCVKRLKSGKTTPFYAMLRVYQVDLLGCRKKGADLKRPDLFTVEIPPQSISWRAAETRLREAVARGDAEYIGWIVPGDELKLNMSSQTSGQVGDLLAEYPDQDEMNRWVCDGFYEAHRLRLRPRVLAGEGLTDDAPSCARNLVAKGGWHPSVDVVMSSCQAIVIRRDITGRPRLHSDRGLPVSWRVSDAEPLIPQGGE